MDDILRFTIAINNLDRRIAELNIEIAKDSNTSDYNRELELLLRDREKILSGSNQELRELIKKYGSKNDE